MALKGGAAMRNVLVAYDGSVGAKAALEDLKRNRAGLPKEAEVVVLCIADVWTASRFASFGAYGLDAEPVTEAQLHAIEEAEHAALKAARQVALKASEELHTERPGWEVRAESCADAPAWGIVKRAEEWKADLIVMGSHGRSAVGRFMLGSVSQVVVREAPCAVRVVRGRVGERDAPSCLIIGFDGSPDAEAAVQAVAERVWSPGSTSRLVTAIDGRLSTAVSLRRGIERLRATGLFVTPVVKRGDPRTVLIEEAKRWDADGLFVGARGLRGIKRFLLGSVSTAVAMHAPCPVEVVRPIPRGSRQGHVGQQRAMQAAAA